MPRKQESNKRTTKNNASERAKHARSFRNQQRLQSSISAPGDEDYTPTASSQSCPSSPAIEENHPLRCKYRSVHLYLYLLNYQINYLADWERKRDARGRYTPTETLRCRASSSSSYQASSSSSQVPEAAPQRVNREDLNDVELLQRKVEVCNIKDLRNITKARFAEMWQLGIMSELLSKCRKFHTATTQRRATISWSRRWRKI